MAIYYLDSGGSDSNSGLHPSIPIKTIGRFNSIHSANDSLFIARSKSFTDATLNLKNNVWVDAYGVGALPIINRSDVAACVTINNVTGFLFNLNLVGPTTGSPTNSLITLSNAITDTRIYNCELVGGFDSITFAAGASAASGTGVQIKGVTVTDSWNDAISFNGTISNVLVDECTTSGQGILYQGLGAGDGVTSHDTATYTARNCTFRSGQRGAVNIHTSGTCMIERCIFIADSNTAGAGGVGSALIGHGGIGGTTTLRNSIIYTSGANQTNVVGCSLGTLVAQNNTIISNNTHTGSYNFRIDTAGVIQGTNNISYINNAVHQHVRDDINASVMNYNNYFPNTGSLFQVLGFDGNFATWQSLGKDANGFVTDPQLTNTTTPSTWEDAKLLYNSPCRKTGTDLSAQFTDDYGNNIRPELWDLGAIQSSIQASRAAKNLAYRKMIERRGLNRAYRGRIPVL